MNDRDRKDEARVLRRSMKNHRDEDHGRYGITWAQRFGGRVKKDG